MHRASSRPGPPRPETSRGTLPPPRPPTRRRSIVESTVDRTRLAELMARELARFDAEHPRSHDLFERSKANLLAGVPMPWMTEWAGSFPVFVAEAQGRALQRRRRARVRGPVPGRHRGDDGSRAEGGGGRDRRAGREGHHADAPHRGFDLGGRRDGAAVRAPLLAVLPDGDRCEPLHDPSRARDHRAPEDPRLQLVLPRLGGRDDRHDRRAGRDRPATRQRRARREPGRDHARGRVQRPRRARGGARARGRRVRPGRAGPHEHRHRAPRPRLPRGAPRDDAEPRDLPRDRRDPHHLRRTRRGDEGVGPGARLPHDRQAARERRSGRHLRDERRGRRALPGLHGRRFPRPTSAASAGR